VDTARRSHVWRRAGTSGAEAGRSGSSAENRSPPPPETARSIGPHKRTEQTYIDHIHTYIYSIQQKTRAVVPEYGAFVRRGQVACYQWRGQVDGPSDYLYTAVFELLVQAQGIRQKERPATHERTYRQITHTYIPYKNNLYTISRDKRLNFYLSCMYVHTYIHTHF